MLLSYISDAANVPVKLIAPIQYGLLSEPLCDHPDIYGVGTGKTLLHWIEKETAAYSLPQSPNSNMEICHGGLQVTKQTSSKVCFDAMAG